MSWIPRREIYCSVCRRMVAAETTPARPGVLVPADHYRFASRVAPMSDLRGTMAFRCSGSGHVYAGEPGITHGREDRLAAFGVSTPARYTGVVRSRNDAPNPLKYWWRKT